MLLVVAWAVVLLPPLLQRLLNARPAGARRDPLAALARRQNAAPATPAVAPRASDDAPTFDPVMPASVEAARQRRWLVAGLLGGAALVTLVLVPSLGAAAIGLHLVVDAVLAPFAYMWWQRGQRPARLVAPVVNLATVRPTTVQPMMIPADLPQVVNG